MLMSHADIDEEFREQVLAARPARRPLVIRGSGSKWFYGRDCSGQTLNTGRCAGILSYEPTELVITARAGTSLHEIETVLAEHRQMLPFEPPYFGAGATLGGAVASGLAGPRRPYTGAVRDFILGIRCLTGHGEILTFGGQVMKNVAGYDVSRLMAGALGTLGLLLEVSIKVLPQPEVEIYLSRPMDFESALKNMNAWAGRPLPLSAAVYDKQCLSVRLSGKQAAVAQARETLDMNETEGGLAYWQRLRDQQLEFFNLQDQPLWRISVPSTTGAMDLKGDWLIDWGGAQRWLKSGEPMHRIREVTARAGGHATLFRGGAAQGEVFQPLAPGIRQLHLRLKQLFDPDGIFNRGRMYPEF